MTMNNNKIKIGVVGLGTVGSGVINLLKKIKQRLKKVWFLYRYTVYQQLIKIKKEIVYK